MTSSLIWLRRSSKAFAKTKLAPKKGHGHCLVIWSTTAFCIPVKQLHLRSTLSKSTRCAGSCNARSQHSSMERARLLSPTVPDHTAHNQGFKSLINRASKVCFLCHIHLTSHQPTTTSQPSRELFAGKMLPEPAEGRKCFPRVHRIPEYWFWYYRDKQTYFLLAKMCWL